MCWCGFPPLGHQRYDFETHIFVKVQGTLRWQMNSNLLLFTLFWMRVLLTFASMQLYHWIHRMLSKVLVAALKT